MKRKKYEIRESENDRAYLKRRRIYSLISLIVLIAVFAMATAILWKPLIGTFQQPKKFRSWVDMHGLLGKLAFVGIDMLQVIFAVIPGEPIELGGGYAFGAVGGLFLCLIGDAVGTAVIFLFTKCLGMKLVESVIGKKRIHSLSFIRDSKKLNLLVFLLFFIPGTPKDVLTYFIGITPMKLRTFLILASIGRIPSILTSTITGDALGVQDYKTAAFVYVITGAAGIIGIFIYRKMSGRIQKNEEKRP